MELNDYERERAERIARNKAMLEQLQIQRLAAETAESAADYNRAGQPPVTAEELEER